MTKKTFIVRQGRKKNREKGAFPRPQRKNHFTSTSSGRRKGEGKSIGKGNGERCGEGRFYSLLGGCTLFSDENGGNRGRQEIDESIAGRKEKGRAPKKGPSTTAG